MPHVFYAARAGGLPGASGAAAWGRARRGDFRDAQGGSGCAGHAQPVGAARHARGAAGRARQTAVAAGKVADLVGAESAVAEVAPRFSSGMAGVQNLFKTALERTISSENCMRNGKFVSPCGFEPQPHQGPPANEAKGRRNTRRMARGLPRMHAG